MSYMIDLRVLELLCSRICHDLISPVTAINNGMELLDDDPGDMLNDIKDLLMNSASEGAGKLQYFRLAYGLGGDPDGEIGIGSAADLTVRLEKHEKSSISWPADRERMLPRLTIKSAMNMVLMAIEALPRGGAITVSFDNGGIQVIAAGQGARVEADSLKTLTAGTSVDSVTPRSIQTFFTGQVVAAAGGAISIDASETDKVTLRADFAA
jgi:histidine phosphotransferase ChpT